jgi:hypothetical protein
MRIIQILFLMTSFLHSSYAEDNEKQNLLESQQKVNQSQSMQRSSLMQESTGNYFIKFINDLSKIKAGDEVILSFSPKVKGDENIIVELETVHEKKAHIILVSEDLEYFSHLHPDYEGNGNYSVKTNLPFGGKYELFIEYKPKGGKKITDRFNLNADGSEKSKAIFKSERYLFEDQNLSVMLHPTEDLFSGNEIHIPVSILKDGKELNAANFDNYLGEKAHAVLIGIANFNFLHVHPMVMNNQLNLHMNIVNSGYYRLWLQFQIDGILYSTDFVLKAKPSNQLNEKQEPNHNQHKH